MSWYWYVNWQPPNSLSADAWIPLMNLWGAQDVDGMTDTRDSELLAWLVISYIPENHGFNSLPDMLTALDTASSMDEWLATVTDQRLSEFETGWRQWVINRE